MDNTNLITWGASAEQNYCILTAVHTQCEAWARIYGARFAPKKYQLIYFTRNRRHAHEDLASTVLINGHQIEIQKKSIKVLGV